MFLAFIMYIASQKKMENFRFKPARLQQALQGTYINSKCAYVQDKYSMYDLTHWHLSHGQHISSMLQQVIQNQISNNLFSQIKGNAE
jgi:hypothetical protein